MIFKINTLCFIVVCCFLFATANIIAQTRIAVLPFQNKDGLMDLNVWSYKLQDSLYKSLKEQDPAQENFVVVPADSIEAVLSSMNLDPNNPQYLSDMWKAVISLNIQKVITGNFNIQAEKFLINAYIYDVVTKMPNPRFQARDIFKSQAEIMESIGIITRRLMPGLKK